MVSETCQSWADLQGISEVRNLQASLGSCTMGREALLASGIVEAVWDSAVFQEDAK